MPAPPEPAAPGTGGPGSRDVPDGAAPARPGAAPHGGSPDARGADPEARPDAAPAADGGGSREVFQYALLRLVPSTERGEGLNVGVVLHARRHRFLGLRVALDHERLRALDPTLDLDAVQRHLHGLQRVADGDPAAGAIAAMPRSDRFGWLAAPSNTIVQPSPVHTGLCDDAAATLERLVARLVLVGG